ncbi:D-ribose pyranase [Alicyclobacillus cellulosilyticus]|uniref:D-ribose pyranase n=1 Tax=Alicyclobacillus cellulosilyticus TaxID=1003997 RepID=A0A917K8J4_9BACL|nr:D-ribose pyranase [Alicyclobacillus cellulosilyticus]GGJ02155.1 D-ribose pyranase [Alicyclobacillus cellulosilyticus]
MKKSGILHPQLLSLLARTGHTDYFTVCDRGFPVPAHVERIDLALVDDVPTVLDVLRAVEREFSVDRIIVSDEMRMVSPGRYEVIRREFPSMNIESVPHLELKRLAAQGKAVVRTGDTCPYANLIIVSG